MFSFADGMDPDGLSNGGGNRSNASKFLFIMIIGIATGLQEKITLCEDMPCTGTN